MPILNNTQGQEMTQTTNGSNPTAKLVAQSHFFIDNIGFTQNQNQCFGALNDAVFRTTSQISGYSGSVYALCKGQVLLQPTNGEDNKVNLILKPFEQPINSLPIKYIIYRGLPKNQFINPATNPVQIAPKDEAASGFINFIWNEFEKFYGTEDGNELPEFLVEFIGYPKTETNNPQLPTDYIEKYFQKISASYQEELNEDPSLEKYQYELPMVPAGTQLATLADGILGIDIVLENGNYYTDEPTEQNPSIPFHLNLNYARSYDHVIDTSSLAQDYEKKLLKESATQFIDIVAFYGMHTQGKGTLYMGDTSLTTIEEIYNILQPFYTKNTLYIYLQAERQRSYNFYDNYNYSNQNNNNLKLETDLNNLNTTTFGTLGWPIHTLTMENLSQPHVFMQLTTDAEQDSSLYMQTGYLLNSKHENNFVRNDNLLQTNDENTENPVDTRYTKVIDFLFNSISTETQHTVPSSLLQLVYEGNRLYIEEDAPPPEEGEPQATTPYYIKDIDDLFGLIDAKSFMAKREDQLPSLTDNKLQIINFPVTAAKDIATVTTQKVTDKLQTVDDQTFLERVTYATLLSSNKVQTNTYTQRSNPKPEAGFSALQSYGTEQLPFYQPQAPYYLKTQVFTDGGNTVTGLTLQTTNGTKPTKKLLGITEAENQLLVNTINTHQLRSPKVYFKNTLYSEKDTYLSPENISYKAYTLAVAGEDPNGSLKLYDPLDENSNTTEIKVYTIDLFIYSSKEYGKWVKDLLLPKKIIISLNKNAGLWKIQQ